MRTIQLLPAIVLIVSACDDALGPGAACRDVMKTVRTERGSPDQVQSDENAGDFFESWTYFPSGSDPGASYYFRWGASYDKCYVDGPANFDLTPDASGSAVSSLLDAPAQAVRLVTDHAA